MPLLKYIPLQLTFFLILGILTGLYFNLNTFVVMLSLISLLSILGIVYILVRKINISSIFFTIASFLTFYFVGIASITFHNDLNQKEHYTNYLSKQNPVKTLIKVKTILKANTYYDKYEALVLKIDNQETQGKVREDKAPSGPDRLYRGLQQGDPAGAGETLQGTARVREVHRASQARRDL